MSGRMASAGALAKEAIHLYVDQFNSQGGAAGHKLEVVFADDKSKPFYAERLAENLIQDDHVDFLMGVLSSESAIKVSEVSCKYRKIFIGTTHTASSLTIEHFQPYYFHTRRNTFQAMAAGALFLKELRKTKPWHNLVYIGGDYIYGRSLLDELQYNLKRFNIDYRLSAAFWPKLYTRDYDPFITAILREQPDILVIGLYGGDLRKFVSQCNARKLFPKIIACNFDAGDFYNTLMILKDEIPTGMYASTTYSPNWPETEENRQFVKGYRQVTGKFPTVVVHDFYSALLLLVKAINEVGTPHDTEALVKAMEAMEIKLPGDPEGFVSHVDRATHQIIQAISVGRLQDNATYPPATRMPGDWQVFRAEDLLPPPEYVRDRRANFKKRGSEGAKDESPE
ncbi:MAG: ABC transporter substrate-binding protein [Syntrophaceae bacterium]|nr:ABC transporter substrate-binding protein [Syntrophaceae bacterium]